MVSVDRNDEWIEPILDFRFVADGCPTSPPNLKLIQNKKEFWGPLDYNPTILITHYHDDTVAFARLRTSILPYASERRAHSVDFGAL